MTRLCLLAIAAGFLLPLSATTHAQGACQINLNGIFTIYETAKKAYVTLNLTQNGTTITGTATGVRNGQISNGSLTGRHVTFTVTWPSGTAGLYSWKVNSAGALANGQTQDVGDPHSASALTSKSKFCQ